MDWCHCCSNDSERLDGALKDASPQMTILAQAFDATIEQSARTDVCFGGGEFGAARRAAAVVGRVTPLGPWPGRADCPVIDWPGIRGSGDSNDRAECHRRGYQLIGSHLLTTYPSLPCVHCPTITGALLLGRVNSTPYLH
ncbi:hypothetical protein J6590_047109 [Homalodisca vitripennis]|nr:hypothetical protein J6590_047109 [Homalodisca vitripennis]